MGPKSGPKKAKNKAKARQKTENIKNVVFYLVVAYTCLPKNEVVYKLLR